MTKQEYIAAIAEKTGHTKTVVADILAAQETVVGQGLKAGREIVLPGLGKLTRKTRAARQGRNPQTGAVVQIAARAAVSFKAVKALNDAVA